MQRSFAHSSADVQASTDAVNVDDVVLTNWTIRVRRTIRSSRSILAFGIEARQRHPTRQALTRIANPIPASHLSRGPMIVRTIDSEVIALRGRRGEAKESTVGG
jgi:hypothetical protein